MRATKSVTSPSAKALSSDSIGTPWRTSANWAETGAPTFCDGEFWRTRSGKRASMASVAHTQRVVVGVGNLGRGLGVEGVVAGHLGGETGQFGLRPRLGSGMSTDGSAMATVLASSRSLGPDARLADDMEFKRTHRAAAVMPVGNRFRGVRMSRSFRLAALSCVAALALLACAQHDRGGHAARRRLGPSSTVANHDQLLADVRILSADDMEGRGTGTPGSERARAYIVSRLEALGIAAPPVGRLQPFAAAGPHARGTQDLQRRQHSGPRCWDTRAGSLHRGHRPLRPRRDQRRPVSSTAPTTTPRASRRCWRSLRG